MCIISGFQPAKVEKRARAQHVTDKAWDRFENIFWFLKHNVTASNSLFGHQTSSRKVPFLPVRASTIRSHLLTCAQMRSIAPKTLIYLSAIEHNWAQVSATGRNCAHIALKNCCVLWIINPNWAQYERNLSAIWAQNDRKILFQALNYKYYYERNLSAIEQEFSNRGLTKLRSYCAHSAIWAQFSVI